MVGMDMGAGRQAVPQAKSRQAGREEGRHLYAAYKHGTHGGLAFSVACIAGLAEKVARKGHG